MMQPVHPGKVIDSLKPIKLLERAKKSSAFLRASDYLKNFHKKGTMAEKLEGKYEFM